MSSFSANYGSTVSPAHDDGDISNLAPETSNHELNIFIKEVPVELICPIHFGILDNPTECSNGHLICEHCIMRWWASSGVQSCPVCKVDGDFDSSLSARALINNLDVICPNHCAFSDTTTAETGSGGGCEWRGKYMTLSSHIDNCPFEQVKCKNIPCAASIKRQDIKNHEATECIYRKVSCEYCAQKCVFSQLDVHHQSTCAHYEVRCECGMSLKRSELAEHAASVCPDAIVTCPFKVHGCRKANMYRHEYAAHQTTEADYHSKLLAEKLTLVIKQQQEYAQMHDDKLQQVEKRLVSYVNSAEQSMVSIETSLLEKIRVLEQTVADLSTVTSTTAINRTNSNNSIRDDTGSGNNSKE